MMKLSTRTRSSRRRGSTVIELTLVLLTVVAILIATIDVAQVVYFQHSLVYRARKTVRWASTVAYNETQIRNMMIYDNAAGGSTPALLGLNSSNGNGASIVSVQLLEAGTTSARVQVRVDNYPFRFFTPFIAGAYTAKPVIATYTHEPSLP